jgi:hypothetical protein
MKIKKICIDCGKEICNKAIRCRSCSKKGKLNHNFKKFKTKYYCKLCKVKEICYCTWHYGKQMCCSCAMKERFEDKHNHPRFIDGKSHTNEGRRKYYHKNKKRLTNLHEKWRKNNREKVNKYIRLKRKKNINFRILCNLRRRITHAIRNNSKSKSTIKLLNCSIKEFKYYLESKFTNKMSWSNYGTYWEIDHIKSCCTFDLSKIEEQKKCFHYSNMRPLTIKENRRRKR